mmetsp:Transcript_23586/g.61529  ORF Transcript_23586/g.61529 Transcript_23586/m.61529 type:complete len:84 (-) Transcript_23586:441-692(-)
MVSLMLFEPINPCEQGGLEVCISGPLICISGRHLRFELLHDRCQLPLLAAAWLLCLRASLLIGFRPGELLEDFKVGVKKNLAL